MKKEQRKNSAELQALRLRLNLTDSDLARIFGVTIDTVKNWLRTQFFNGKHRFKNYAHQDVLDKLNEMLVFIDEVAANSCEVIETKIPAVENLKINLVAYNRTDYKKYFTAKERENLPTNKIHLALLAETKLQAESRFKNIEVNICWFIADKYESWLRLNNKKDSQQNRALWTSEFY